MEFLVEIGESAGIRPWLAHKQFGECGDGALPRLDGPEARHHTCPLTTRGLSPHVSRRNKDCTVRREPLVERVTLGSDD